MQTHISALHAIILGIIEGVTEFLPVSSTGHLTVAERLLGYSTDAASVTAFTAIIQTGAVAAVVVFLRRDVVRLVRAGVAGVADAGARRHPDARLAWAVLLGSIPIGLVGLAFKSQIETGLRSLWIVAVALIAWSAVMALADRRASAMRGERDVTWHDTLFMGVAQCIALIPGVSRSGATLAAGLVRGLDRVTVTRLSFLLSIPALLGAGALEALTNLSTIGPQVGWGSTALATLVSFAVAYAAVAWLLRFVAQRTFGVFIAYRVVLGLIVIVLLMTGLVAPT